MLFIFRQVLKNIAKIKPQKLGAYCTIITMEELSWFQYSPKWNWSRKSTKNRNPTLDLSHLQA